MPRDDGKTHEIEWRHLSTFEQVVCVNRQYQVPLKWKQCGLCVR